MEHSIEQIWTYFCTFWGRGFLTSPPLRVLTSPALAASRLKLRSSSVRPSRSTGITIVCKHTCKWDIIAINTLQFCILCLENEFMGSMILPYKIKWWFQRKWLVLGNCSTEHTQAKDFLKHSDSSLGPREKQGYGQNHLNVSMAKCKKDVTPLELRLSCTNPSI